MKFPKHLACLVSTLRRHFVLLITGTQKYERGLSGVTTVDTTNAWCPALVDCSSEDSVQAIQPWRSIVVFNSVSTGLQDISMTTVYLCPKFPVANIYDLPDVVNYLFHVFAAARMEAVLFCRQTSCLEFTAWWSAWSSCWLRTFSAELENWKYAPRIKHEVHRMTRSRDIVEPYLSCPADLTPLYATRCKAGGGSRLYKFYDVITDVIRPGSTICEEHRPIGEHCVKIPSYCNKNCQRRSILKKKLWTERQTDTSTDNMDRSKLSDREPVITAAQ